MIGKLVLSAVAIPHLFAGWVSEATMNSDQATITIPATAPSGAEYAWVMAAGTQDCDFTQVGWAWAPAYGIRTPQIFAYTQMCGQPGRWAFGPYLTLNSSLTVRITRTNHLYTDQAFLPGVPGMSGAWVTYQTAVIAEYPLWIVDLESYGPMQHVCFAKRGCVG